MRDHCLIVPRLALLLVHAAQLELNTTPCGIRMGAVCWTYHSHHDCRPTNGACHSDCFASSKWMLGCSCTSSSQDALACTLPSCCWRRNSSRGTKRSDTELIQYRNRVGGGPSVNTWPRCASDTADRTSTLSMPCDVSRYSVTWSAWTGCVKLGQPQPASNFARASNSGRPLTMSTYTPSGARVSTTGHTPHTDAHDAPSLLWSLNVPVNGLSVPHCTTTWRSVGVSVACLGGYAMRTSSLLHHGPQRSGARPTWRLELLRPGATCHTRTWKACTLAHPRRVKRVPSSTALALIAWRRTMRIVPTPDATSRPQ